MSQPGSRYQAARFAASKLPRLPSAEFQQALTRLYRDLGWGEARQIGLNLRVCGYSHPRTTQEAEKIYQAIQAILRRLLKPHYPQLIALVRVLMGYRYDLSPWEQQFLEDIAKKMSDPRKVSPAMVKKVREIAHKYEIPTGFPSFKELAVAYDQDQARRKITEEPDKS